MNVPGLTIRAEFSWDDVAFLENRLDEFNAARTGLRQGRWLGVVARDHERRVLAGICGSTWATCAEIRQLWVHEALHRRGLGSRLLRDFESEARGRGCSQVVLTTFTFQAPAFYAARGFEVVARIDDYPPGHGNVVMRKRLRPAVQ